MIIKHYKIYSKLRKHLSAGNTELKTRPIGKHHVFPFLHVGIRTRYVPNGL